MNLERNGWKVPSLMMSAKNPGVNAATRAKRLMMVDVFKERALAFKSKASFSRHVVLINAPTFSHPWEDQVEAPQRDWSLNVRCAREKTR